MPGTSGLNCSRGGKLERLPVEPGLDDAERFTDAVPVATEGIRDDLFELIPAEGREVSEPPLVPQPSPPRGDVYERGEGDNGDRGTPGEDDQLRGHATRSGRTGGCCCAADNDCPNRRSPDCATVRSTATPPAACSPPGSPPRNYRPCSAEPPAAATAPTSPPDSTASAAGAPPSTSPSPPRSPRPSTAGDQRYRRSPQTAITNAGTEGTNRHVKQVLREVCGFRNKHHHQDRARLHCAQRAPARATLPAVR